MSWKECAQILSPGAWICTGAGRSCRYHDNCQAVEFIGGNNIPAGQVIDDDVFIGGDNVVIDGTVNGDLFASGSTVTVNGVVKGSFDRYWSDN